MSQQGGGAPSTTGGSVDASIAKSPSTSASWTAVLSDVARDRVNQVVFIATAIVVTFAYSMLLTFAYTQRFSWANWHYLYARLLIWSVVLAIAMASVVVLQVHAMRRVKAARSRTGVVGGLAFVGSVLPSLLCCTPIIPTALAFVGFSTVSVYGTTGTLQHFFATYQTQFFVASLALVALTAWWSVHRIAESTCLIDGCEPESHGDLKSTRTQTKTSVTEGSL